LITFTLQFSSMIINIQKSNIERQKKGIVVREAKRGLSSSSLEPKTEPGKVVGIVIWTLLEFAFTA
jgi:hypothetical protein